MYTHVTYSKTYMFSVPGLTQSGLLGQPAPPLKGANHNISLYIYI